MKNQTLETIWRRSSIRKYKPDPIPEEDLHWILEAARQAPTGGNRQKWRLVVVRDAEQRRRLAAACNEQMWMADAPVILCMTVLPGQDKVNGTIVLDHAILAATSLGYGTCWIGAYDPDEVREVLGIPNDYGIVCLTPVGVGAEEGRDRPRKSPSELFRQESFSATLDYDPPA
jgi:nitroreductase